MKKLIVVMLMSSAIAHATPSETAQAAAAYQAKQYARCAQLWSAIAANQSRDKAGDKVGESLYSEACCQALDGKADAAFSALDRAIKSGWRDLANTEADTDLTSLHADARWPKMLATLKATVAAWEKSLGDPALRREILTMVDVDQKARFALIGDGFKDKTKLEQMAAIDRKNTTRMKEIVAAKGWPTPALVGQDGAAAAWLLVQHADHDLPFQKLCLAKMEPLLKTGGVAPLNYAYLVDRVAVAEKRKQTYGTQFDGNQQPRPIEDEAHVDERRKAVGLGTMAEYKQQMLRMYGPPKPKQ